MMSYAIYLPVFHAPPQPFDKDVVPPTAGAVPTDLDVMGFQESRELLAGELAPWSVLKRVGVPELARAS